MTDLRTAALRALEAMEDAHNLLPGMYDKHILGIKQRHFNAITALKAALAQQEDKSQAAFEHWVETVEATQGCAISRNAVADAGSIIKPEIKGHNAEPPPEAQTEAEKIAYCAGWWAAMEAAKRQWNGLTDEERDYFRACGFVGVSRVEEVLRAKNSTLACIPAVPPG